MCYLFRPQLIIAVKSIFFFHLIRVLSFHATIKKDSILIHLTGVRQTCCRQFHFYFTKFVQADQICGLEK